MHCVCICSINSFTLNVHCASAKQKEKKHKTTHDYYANIFQTGVQYISHSTANSHIIINKKEKKHVMLCAIHGNKKMEVQAQLTEMEKARLESAE